MNFNRMAMVIGLIAAVAALVALPSNPPLFAFFVILNLSLVALNASIVFGRGKS